jgi:hypothetical protein
MAGASLAVTADQVGESQNAPQAPYGTYRRLPLLSSPEAGVDS